MSDLPWLLLFILTLISLKIFPVSWIKEGTHVQISTPTYALASSKHIILELSRVRKMPSRSSTITIWKFYRMRCRTLTLTTLRYTTYNHENSTYFLFPVFLRKVPTYVCSVYDYAEEKNLSFWNPKRKLGEATNFAEIISLASIRNLMSYIYIFSKKKKKLRGYLPIFILDFNCTLTRICFSVIVINNAKIPLF